jgi:gas vesicle protein
MTRRGRKRLRDFALLTAGVGIGSGVALLMAPYAGKEVRFALGRGYRRTAKRIGRQTEDLRERAKDVLEHAHDFGKHSRKLLRRYRAA